MKQIIVKSQTGNLQEALNKERITSPSVLLLISNNEQFEEHVAQFEAAFPGVPSIGCIDMSYGSCLYGRRYSHSQCVGTGVQHACEIHKVAAK